MLPRSHPAKQVTRIPRSPCRSDRLGVLSAWAGQRHIAVRPCQVPPSAPTRLMSSWEGGLAVRDMIGSFQPLGSPLPFSSAVVGVDLSSQWFPVRLGVELLIRIFMNSEGASPPSSDFPVKGIGDHRQSGADLMTLRSSARGVRASYPVCLGSLQPVCPEGEDGSEIIGQSAPVA